jgi:putative acetyltransferase
MNAAPIEIREMTISDYEDVAALWRQTENVGLNDADSAPGVAAYLERNPRMSFVALSAGRVVGAILCGHDGRRGYLHHLAVARDIRNQGLGRRLVNECLSRLKEQGIQKCNIFMFEENAPGRAFWSHTGWTLRTELCVMSRMI